jgi:endo-1,4-beta-D-glucanase Y
MRRRFDIAQYCGFATLWFIAFPTVSLSMESYQRVQGVCQAEGKDPLIDDMEDQDARIAACEGRFKSRQPEVEAATAGSMAWRAFKPDEINLQQVRAEYENWKARYFVRCGDGSADVRKGGREAVSEGTGYGMLLAVTMGDREVFDQLTQGFLKRKNARGMMSWQFEVCGPSWSENAATDGDLDIAMALVMADHKWKSYRYLAEALISSIKQHGSSTCDNLSVLRPGDMWGGCKDPSDQRLNPSYFAPGYYRVFGQYVPNQADFWNQLTKDSYVLLRRYQAKMGGLFPDWSLVDGTVIGSYGYEACRVPWRISVDYAWHGSAEAKEILQGLHDYVQSRGGPASASDQNNSCFIGGFALTANAISSAKSNLWYRSWMTSADLNAGDQAYYQGSLRVLYLQLAGALFVPSADTKEQPKMPSPDKSLDPASPYPACQSNQGQGFGSSWQSEGKTLAKDSPDYSDLSICEIVAASSGSPSLPLCTQNAGKGYGDSWLKNGVRLAKDSPDYSATSICRVRTD